MTMLRMKTMLRRQPVMLSDFDKFDRSNNMLQLPPLSVASHYIRGMFPEWSDLGPFRWVLDCGPVDPTLEMAIQIAQGIHSRP